jgi:enamine deaminase RidA (YjgF/YER057c/UK114 family)
VTLRPLTLGILALGLLCACEAEKEAPAEAPRLRQVFHLNAYEPGFGYAQAVKIGKTVYVSGTVAVDAQGRLVAPGDMAGQLSAVYQNLGLTLKAFGAGFENVAMERVYVTDMAAFLKVSDQRLAIYPHESLPAASFVEVRKLVDPGFLVQVDLTVELP